MQILRARDHKITPWRNGGGLTTEIFVSPFGAGLDDFDWRVSMAGVTSDGPFSYFAGIDRTLAVLSGRGVELIVADAPPAALTPSTPPFDFPGDQPTAARLLDGPIVDLNVMVRRGRRRHNVMRLSLDAPYRHALQGTACLLICTEGQLRFNNAVLSPLDAAVIEPAATTIELFPASCAMVYLVEIHSLIETRMEVGADPAKA